MALVPIEQLLYGIRNVESGGTKNPYSVVNSIGATGAYQVMKGNIASWTKEVLGRAYTQAEFIADPAAQDKVAAFRLERDMKKYGSWESAASVWFSGQPNPNSGASDGGNTVRQYVSKVRQAMAGWKPGAGVPTTPATGGTPVGLPEAVSGGLTGVLTGIGKAFTSWAESLVSVAGVARMLMALALPTTWVRIICGIAGFVFLLLGLLVLGREAKGSQA